MCQALKFPRSTYYKALVCVPSKRKQEYQEFSDKVKACFHENKGRYGAIKLHHVLNASGTECSLKRVQRHMQRLGLHSIVIKKYNHKANQGKVPNDKENVLDRDFAADTINQKWVTDITYIHVLKEGWTYLASVMDLYDRKIIGYAYGKHMTSELALEAVKNACLNVKDTTGIILHSDLGSQYTSDLFERYMTANGFIHSFSRKGNPYDNACIESFHSVMKKEEIYVHDYQDFEECRKALFEYIESWYNRKRIHSALGYKTPQQMEDEAIHVA